MNLKSKILLVSLLLWLGVLNSDCLASAPSDRQVLHIIDRLSFGPRPGDFERVKSMGVERYIQEQLSPDSIPYPTDLTNQLNSLETVNLTPEELLAEYTPPRGTAGQKPSKEEIKAYRQRSRIVLAQAVAARLRQDIESPRQLQEVMTDFWYNHFNVYADKGVDRLLVGAYEAEAIRPYALGHFRTLLWATAQHPAMLFYLDNWQNTAPGSPGARGRFQGLNENYAREVMELHTLGVNNGYTQQDVITLAQILTGWTFRRPGQQMTNETGFYFDPRRHDFSDKVFLGQKIKGSGVEEGEEALDILARSPATARHISYELAQYFVADEPPPGLVERLTQKFLATNGDIREVLNTLFHSPEFADPKYYSAKFKTPYQYVVSAIRATGMEVNNFRPLYNTLQQLGMPLYGCLTPDGYKDTQDMWLNPAAMTLRLSFATALANGHLHLEQPPQVTGAGGQGRLGVPSGELGVPTKWGLGAGGQGGIKDRPLAAEWSLNSPTGLPTSTVLPLPNSIDLANTLGNQFSLETQRAIAESPPQLQAALMLGSPEFMHY